MVEAAVSLAPPADDGLVLLPPADDGLVLLPDLLGADAPGVLRQRLDGEPEVVTVRFDEGTSV
ncbi:hypothetical protein [Streptomyces sp. AGS-58]|uniref:hypothetical protein n=1 Tax=unclassified Streptomyces TaxID=2593676 RepID=UPI0035A3A060